VCASAPTTAPAHESWVEAVRYQLQAPATITADVRVGQHFKGDSYRYNPNLMADLQLVNIGGSSPIKATLGQRPAINVETAVDGLHVLIYRSAVRSVSYETFAKFEDFLNLDGLTSVLAAHAKRGLPREGFSETYRRFAKALIKVGAGEGKDGPIGMPLELVAIDNPYVTTGSETIRVKLLWHQQPLPSAQITVFRKRPGTETKRTKFISDQSGIAAIPRGTGGRLLLSAVHMIPAEPAANEFRAVWESLWASMTFELGAPVNE
jgi:hypothetical protein